MARSDSIGFFWQDLPPEKPAKAEKLKRQPPEPVWLLPTYLPGLVEALRFPVQRFTDGELVEAAIARERLVFDIECYENYWLIAFKSMVTGRVNYFELTPTHPLHIAKLKWIIANFTLVSFNGIGYDAPILALALAGKTNLQMKAATNEIIVNGTRPSDVLRSYKVKALKFDHIDIIEVAPLMASLKIYGGRLHGRKMQDLPFAPGTLLNSDQMAITRWYCVNDLDNTHILYESLKEEISLRESMSKEYDIDLRSKSDAQVAEAVIAHEVESMTGYRAKRPTIAPGTMYHYRVPRFIQYETPLVNWALDLVRKTPFIVSEEGNIGMPPELKELEIKIAQSTYRMGIGGLHSSEECQAIVPAADEELVDIDMTSYYPFIILNENLYPQHLGPNFLKVYRKLVYRRIDAKRAGDKVVADSLKITINGSFGKLGSQYSVLYAPDLLVQVTLTGQLTLLMLIEMLELRGFRVVSANTDGIAVLYKKSDRVLFDQIIKYFEDCTRFQTEEVRYKALYSRDVNNYIAVKREYDKVAKLWTDKVDGCKTKGAYASPKREADRLHKNPTNSVCVSAVLALLTKGTPVDHTIRNCTDIREFVNVRTVKSGAVKVWTKTPAPKHDSQAELVALAGFTEIVEGWFRHEAYPEELAVFALPQAYAEALRMLEKPDRSEYLGKSIRWYYAQGEEGEFVVASSGNTVPRSAGARPLMELPTTMPGDVDFDWYVTEAEKILVAIGYQ